MKNTSIQFIKNLIMTASIAYVIGTFVTWELNPEKWHILGKAIMSICVVFVSIMLIIAQDFEKK